MGYGKCSRSCSWKLKSDSPLWRKSGVKLRRCVTVFGPTHDWRPIFRLGMRVAALFDHGLAEAGAGSGGCVLIESRGRAVNTAT